METFEAVVPDGLAQTYLSGCVEREESPDDDHFKKWVEIDKCVFKFGKSIRSGSAMEYGRKHARHNTRFDEAMFNSLLSKDKKLIPFTKEKETPFWRNIFTDIAIGIIQTTLKETVAKSVAPKIASVATEYFPQLFNFELFSSMMQMISKNAVGGAELTNITSNASVVHSISRGSIVFTVSRNLGAEVRKILNKPAMISLGNGRSMMVRFTLVEDVNVNANTIRLTRAQKRALAIERKAIKRKLKSKRPVLNMERLGRLLEDVTKNPDALKNKRVCHLCRQFTGDVLVIPVAHGSKIQCPDCRRFVRN